MAKYKQTLGSRAIGAIVVVVLLAAGVVAAVYFDVFGNEKVGSVADAAREEAQEFREDHGDAAEDKLVNPVRDDVVDPLNDRLDESDSSSGGSGGRSFNLPGAPSLGGGSQGIDTNAGGPVVIEGTSAQHFLPGEQVIEGVQAFAPLSRDHVLVPVEYPTLPPAGGPHNPWWQNCGFYGVEVPPERAVHSLEHGAIWITYRSDAPLEEVATLAELAERNTHLLVSLHPEQPREYMLTAWERQLPLSSIYDPRFVPFLDLYIGAGPTTPEPNSICHDGFGVPPTQPLVRIPN